MRGTCSRRRKRNRSPLPRRLPSLTRRNAACGPPVSTSASRPRRMRRGRPRDRLALVSTTFPRRAPTPTEPSSSFSANSSQRTRGDRPSSSTAREAPSASNADLSETEIEESTNRPLARRRARRRRPRAARTARSRRARPRQGALRREARRREGEGKRGGRSGGRRPEARPERAGRDETESAKKDGVGVARVARVSRGGFVAPFVSPFRLEERSGPKPEARSPSSRDEGEDIFAPETETARRKARRKRRRRRRRNADERQPRRRRRAEAEAASGGGDGGGARVGARGRAARVPEPEDDVSRRGEVLRAPGPRARRVGEKKKPTDVGGFVGSGSRRFSSVDAGESEGLVRGVSRGTNAGSGSGSGSHISRGNTVARAAVRGRFVPRVPLARQLRGGAATARAARRAARRDAENADPIGSDPATRRAEVAERALLSPRPSTPSPPAPRGAPERARGERPCWVRSRRPRASTARSPLRSSRRRRGRRASRSSRAVDPRRRGRAPSVGAVVLTLVHGALGLGSRSRRPSRTTWTARPRRRRRRASFRTTARTAASRGRATCRAPVGAGQDTVLGVRGEKNTLDTRKTPATDETLRKVPPRAREPAEKGARRRRRPRRRRRRRRRTQSACARRRLGARRAKPPPTRSGPPPRGRRNERLTRESARARRGARAGAERARALQRDATLYSRDMYRRAATRRLFGTTLAARRWFGKRFFFERVRTRVSKSRHATRSMPAFRGTRFLPRPGRPGDAPRARRRGARGRARRVRARARGRRVRDVQTARLVEGDGEPRPRPRPVEPGGPSSQEPVQSRARGRHRGPGTRRRRPGARPRAHAPGVGDGG